MPMLSHVIKKRLTHKQFDNLERVFYRLTRNDQIELDDCLRDIFSGIDCTDVVEVLKELEEKMDGIVTPCSDCEDVLDQVLKYVNESITTAKIKTKQNETERNRK